ncbi:hypothetical protein SDC9_147552 [bioreactor metagenome]|uniref:Uncharacterized protein n=1 Tax=bioreactor metagenome TaxID=1076179 RepID=A0A645EEC4_9ZZZZ
MRAEHVYHAIEHWLYLEIGSIDLHPAGFQARKIENVVDQFEQVLRRIPGQAQQFPLFTIHSAQFQHVEGADDTIERRTDFVADRRREIGLQLGKAECAVAGSAQLLFALFEGFQHAVEGMGHVGDVLRTGQVGA